MNREKSINFKEAEILSNYLTFFKIAQLSNLSSLFQGSGQEMKRVSVL